MVAAAVVMVVVAAATVTEPSPRVPNAPLEAHASGLLVQNSGAFGLLIVPLRMALCSAGSREGICACCSLARIKRNVPSKPAYLATKPAPGIRRGLWLPGAGFGAVPFPAKEDQSRLNGSPDTAGSSIPGSAFFSHVEKKAAGAKFGGMISSGKLRYVHRATRYQRPVSLKSISKSLRLMWVSPSPSSVGFSNTLAQRADSPSRRFWPNRSFSR